MAPSHPLFWVVHCSQRPINHLKKYEVLVNAQSCNLMHPFFNVEISRFRPFPSDPTVSPEPSPALRPAALPSLGPCVASQACALAAQSAAQKGDGDCDAADAEGGSKAIGVIGMVLEQINKSISESIMYIYICVYYKKLCYKRRV